MYMADENILILNDAEIKFLAYFYQYFIFIF